MLIAFLVFKLEGGQVDPSGVTGSWNSPEGIGFKDISYEHLGVLGTNIETNILAHPVRFFYPTCFMNIFFPFLINR